MTRLFLIVVDETGSEITNTGEAVDGGVVDSVDSVDPIEEGVDDLAGPDSNGASEPVDPMVNGELVDPETEEVTETPIDEETLSEDPIESDVEEIPIENVPGEPTNGELVADDLTHPPRDYRHHYNHGYGKYLKSIK